jgi:hypothetical protein
VFTIVGVLPPPKIPRVVEEQELKTLLTSVKSPKSNALPVVDMLYNQLYLQLRLGLFHHQKHHEPHQSHYPQRNYQSATTLLRYNTLTYLNQIVPESELNRSAPDGMVITYIAI